MATLFERDRAPDSSVATTSVPQVDDARALGRGHA